MKYFTDSGSELRIGPGIARGREGTVFRLLGADQTCVKIYGRPDPQLGNRLTAAIAQPPARWRADAQQHRYVAWPRAVVYDAEGRAAGFLMAEVRGVSLVHLYEADSRADALDDPTWATCVAIAREIAVIFGALHPSIVVGDVSPNNVLVTRAGRVCLIDCDSMQYTDPTTRQDWPARMVTADYAPYSPGGQTRPLTADHDLFGLAILICELLMAGQHPYDGRPVGADRPEGRAGNIRLGANRLTRPASLGDRPGLIPATILPSGIRRLIMESFTAGTQASPGRPSALDWVRALDGLTNQITACGRSVYHRYPRYLGRCIWCDQVRAGIGDYFPPPTVSPPRQSTSESKRWVRKPPPPDYGHRPKPGTPPLPTWPDPRKIWKER